jgi:hypothetical protein
MAAFPLPFDDEAIRIQLSLECSTRCDDFVEQRKHSSMTPHVFDVNERGSTIMWTKDVVSKLVGRIEVMSELVSCRNHCA